MRMTCKSPLLHTSVDDAVGGVTSRQINRGGFRHRQSEGQHSQPYKLSGEHRRRASFTCRTETKSDVRAKCAIQHARRIPECGFHTTKRNFSANKLVIHRIYSVSG